MSNYNLTARMQNPIMLKVYIILMALCLCNLKGNCQKSLKGFKFKMKEKKSYKELKITYTNKFDFDVNVTSSKIISKLNLNNFRYTECYNDTLDIIIDLSGKERSLKDVSIKIDTILGRTYRIEDVTPITDILAPGDHTVFILRYNLPRHCKCIFVFRVFSYEGNFSYKFLIDLAKNGRQAIMVEDTVFYRW